MSNQNLNIVIMCGGSGTRLWPLSRKLLPKQFLKLTNKDKTMFQLSCLRVQSLNYNNLLIICNQEHVFIAEKQLEELGITKYSIVGESESKNTAPAIAISCQLLPEDSNILVISSDHVFDDQLFCSCVEKGLQQSHMGIVTFGIKPTFPSTGYGYIKYQNDNEVNHLVKFIEKPQLEVAQEYLKSGDYVWNSGNFLFSNKIMKEEFMVHCPQIWIDVSNVLDKSSQSDSNLKLIKLNPEEFSKLNPENLSIDYAIMEKHTRGKVISYDGLWKDIGSFDSLHEHQLTRDDGNVFEGNVYNENCTNCLVKSSNDKIVATVGLNNLIVIDTEDALLVADKSNSQDIKKIVKRLKADNKHQLDFHTKVFRPWGYYININGDDFSGSKVKRIIVYPGKRLSLQSHNNRSEHWVITKGKARVQVGENFYDLGVNDYIFIPVTKKHRMENLSDQLVEFVETQIGSYLGEDDIIRYQDDFGRV